MNVLAIIQARMGSSRLPNKVLLPLAGKAVIEHVVDRVRHTRLIDDVIVVTSIEPNNLPLIGLCAEKGIRVYVGSENDVLDRYYQAAKLLQPFNIVRITADCPMLDADIIDEIIKSFLVSKVDYLGTNYLPDGMGCEVFTMDALQTAWTNAKLKSDREHVTPYMRNNLNRGTYVYKENLFDRRWTLDEEADFKMIAKVFDALYPVNSNFGLDQIKEFLDANPEIASLNMHIGRNEGYAKSLAEDEIIK